MSESKSSDFSGFSLSDVKPTSVEMETIGVTITSDNLFGDFASAFVDEASRKNPLTADKVNLTAQEVKAYIDYLVLKRIECVAGVCKDFKNLKRLMIPSWIQYCLSMIGTVINREIGITIQPLLQQLPPTQDEEGNETSAYLTFEQAFAISNKISAFRDDLQMVEDAMPRSHYGDEDVMSTAMIAGYVRSMKNLSHVAQSYCSVFMGMKLREEQTFKVLYRKQYDDVSFIRTALTLDEGIY